MQLIMFMSFATLLTLSVATPQYPPSGWRPRGTPFVLPREYLPSAPLKAAAQHEINRERFEYIGQYQVREPLFGVRSNLEKPESQIQSQFQTQPQQPQIQLPNRQFQEQPQTQTQPLPHTTYLNPAPEIPTTTEQYVDDFSTTTEYYATTLVPTTENFLRVQGLPSPHKPAQFRNTNKVIAKPQNTNLKNGQLREQQPQLEKSNIQEQQSLKGQVAFVNTATGKSGKQVVSPVSNTYGVPELESSPVIPTPENTYGVPQIGNQEENQVYNLKSPKNENDDSGSKENTDDSSEKQAENNEETNVAVSNAINTNGQYYILNPDNMLQRVLFMTKSNQEDSGFTAQLRYMPVEPIRDPIYAYNENGQLIRIFRK